MPTLKEIKEDIKAVSSIETITKIYQEIANLKINKIRQTVLDNREFIEELSRLYLLTKKASLIRSGKNSSFDKKKSFIKRKKKRVVIFLSSNEKFYGNIILDIWREVLVYLSENKADFLVIGRIGKYLSEKSGLGHRILCYDLNDDYPETERIKEIVEFIHNYEEAIVFHGKFETIFSQKVVKSNISGVDFSRENNLEIKNYLFEPSSKDVLDFFERELLFSFLNQAILEHQLSKYATRIIAMHQASEKAKETRTKLEIKEKRLKLELFNKKQIELFSGYQLWK